MLPTKFQFIWLSGFRGEDLKKIGQLETRIACGGHVVYQLLAHGQWFTPGTPASSTTKTGCEFFSSPCQRQHELLPVTCLLFTMNVTGVVYNLPPMRKFSIILWGNCPNP
jgi:hypothetical protein